MVFVPFPLTIDGLQMNQEGYEKFAALLADRLTASKKQEITDQKEAIRAAVAEKNFFWHNDYKVPNGVHVYGRRYDPFGPGNYPYEIEKIRQMTANRDTAIWALAQGRPYDLAAADKNTLVLPKVTTNYDPKGAEDPTSYKYGEEALKALTVPPATRSPCLPQRQNFLIWPTPYSSPLTIREGSG
jgi:hypothetical protein